MSDRSQSIRDSVVDVEFTLLLTIGLVVMVIFIFLRHLWATIIPSITVPPRATTSSSRTPNSPPRPPAS